jgi:hypothetical protein
MPASAGMTTYHDVIPAKAGIHMTYGSMDAGLRRHDDMPSV